MAVPVGMPDHALLTRARDGDGEAFEALYRRHHRAATRAAHSYSSRSQLAEDAVQEAFLRILRATQEGGGPQTEFRAYLATTVRHVIAGWTRGERTIASDDLELLAGEDTRDSTTPESRLRWHLLTKAFKSLPTRWQEALWLGEVEGVEPAELAERWNMTPNSAAALTYRAREGLRTAWLDAHVNEGVVPDECRPYVSDLGRYAQDKLTARRTEQVREHLDECDYCPALLLEVGSAALELRVLLLPVVLWSGVAVAGGLAVGGLVGKAAGWVGKIGQKGIAVAAGSAVAVAAVVVAVANPWAPDDADAGAGGPTSQSTDSANDPSADPDDAASTDPADDPTTDPTDDATTEPADSESSDDPTSTYVPPVIGPGTGGDPTAPPTQFTQPTDPDPSDPEPEPTDEPTTAPSPSDPDPTEAPTEAPTDDPTEEPSDPAPAAPVISGVSEQDDDGFVELSGSGGEPGAEVTVRVAGGTSPEGRFVLPKRELPPGAEVGEAATVAADGTWSVRFELRPVSGQSVEALQELEGERSTPSEAYDLPDYELPPPTLNEPEIVDGKVSLSGTGDAGATVTVVVEGGKEDGASVATATVGDDGSWRADQLRVAAAGQTIVAFQTSTDGFESAASEAQVLPVQPDAPVIEYAWVSQGGQMFVWVDAERGADLIVQDTDSEAEVHCRPQGFVGLGFWWWHCDATDGGHFAPGSEIQAIQIVNGVESPPSEPFTLLGHRGDAQAS